MQTTNQHGQRGPVTPYTEDKFLKEQANPKNSKVEAFDEVEAAGRRALYNAKWKERNLGSKLKRFNRRAYKSRHYA